MTDEQKEHLFWLRDTLADAIENINKMLADTDSDFKLDKIRGEAVSMPDSFSEDKESFIAP